MRVNGMVEGSEDGEEQEVGTTVVDVREVVVALLTGRTHQIRVHMAHAGHGLIGDPVYGGRRKLAQKSFSPEALGAISGFNRQALHAAVLGFEHPVTGESLRFDAPLPEDFETLINHIS